MDTFHSHVRENWIGFHGADFVVRSTCCTCHVSWVPWRNGDYFVIVTSSISPALFWGAAIYGRAGFSRHQLCPRDFAQSVKRVLSPGVQHQRIIRPYCISFVFNLHPERRRDGTLESPEGFNYMFSGVRCNLMTLQQDRFQLSEGFF